MSPRSKRPQGRPDAGRIASHLAVMAAVAVVMGVLVACLAIPFAGLVGVAAKDVSKGMVNLPESLEAKDLSQKTRIYDVNGNLIASLYDQNRINVPLGSISRPMVKAIVAIEDYRFYDHGALDIRGTIRAFVTNQANGGAVQGGSSITQQMVKQTLLYQAETEEERAAATEETYARKIRELRYAVAFEKNHTKDWILERYLNIAYFGDGAFGVQSAARHFFSKNAKDLNMLEAATLAGLVKNPVGYDPIDNPERAEARRNVVLERMAQLGILTEKKAERLKGRPIEETLKIETSPNGCQQSRAPFFCDYVVNWLLKDPVLGDTPKERRRTLNNGGLTINTTIDLGMQKAADDAVADGVNQTDQAIGGMAMVEPGTGDVRALAQSRPMGKNKKAGETYLNYTVPKKYGDANGFQAGSTFKLFVLASAINQGIPLSTSINSPQQIHLDDDEFETCDGPYAGDGMGWDVANSTGAGTFNLYTGTQDSVNTFFAQLETQTGMCEPLELAKAMGVNVPPAQQVPSWILGVSDSNPLEMAQAYATFAARGLHCDPRPVTQVLDSSGQPLKDFSSQCEQVMPGATADAVNDILRGVMEGGFGAPLAIDKPSAGKTGTTNSNMAVWFVGYTPELATASMVAGANEFGEWVTLNGQTVGGSYISSAFGSTVAGPIWGQAMAAVSPMLDDTDFQAPPGDEIAGVLTTVPDVTSQTVEAAVQQIEAAGFVAADGGQVDSEVAAGSVAYTSPEAGTQLSSGDTVTYYSSTGTVPKSGNGGKGKGRGKGRG
ncbi:membrane peptidoglycan carboxypeptidase [Nocardioides cavernae]|uniref:Membrane peptidoglycan carboxypeptidase n=1 Tax=Nocardioides cavernae TaxID=1921566 RepID=A0A7Y9H164_9ACTN|nr:transglycosylase domain-containing protein [Nocardioides cavernae]NYE36081.1 membrane peptidoglycan carboxypeptidase [Nocardioides cavernae]